MENEILEKTQKEKTNKTKKVLSISGILVLFVGLLLLAIIVFKQPVKVKFAAAGKLGFNLDAAIVDKDGKIQAPDESLLKLPHYNFIGWFKNAEGTGEKLDLANMTFTETITVYAIWDVIEYSISYLLDGGIIEDSKTNPSFYTVSHDKITPSDNQHNDKDWKMNATELNSFIQEPGLRLVAPTKENAIFAGWEIIDENNNVISGTTVTTIRLNPVGNITLKALWK